MKVKKIVKYLLNSYKSHTVRFTFAASIIIGFVFVGGWFILSFIHKLKYYDSVYLFERMGEQFISDLLCILLVSMTFILPLLLTLDNILAFFIKESHRSLLDYITIILGSIYSYIYASWIKEVCFSADWMDVLVNNQVHTPIYTKSMPTVITVAVISLLGIRYLQKKDIENMPPLAIVCAISVTYLGIIDAVAYGIQVCGDFMLILFPISYILISIRLIVDKIREWKEANVKEKEYKNVFLNKCNKLLMESSRWPLMAFIGVWPLLGIIICILALFGQSPDAIIKAWTTTSDWTLSTKIAPQNVQYDEHYLCTVAAGGHKKVVKPIRMGVRHGHRVVVNRQLCVANAFEQILEEKTPKFHRCVRNFYDKYGFPIARLIHSPYIADIVYFIMKPLEWIFLIVLYLCDVNPENRIAVQYMPKK